MFIWLTALFTLVFLPFCFIFGYPVKLTTAGANLTPDLRKRFPWSSKTPMVTLKAWPWFFRFMEKKGVAAYAFSGYICFRLKRRSTAIHEAIHVTHQSVVSPILYAIAYVLDWLVFTPFRHYFPNRFYMRAPVAETVAYHVTEHAMREDPTETELEQ